MAKELAHFKNFAKLKDTSVEFNDITVLAGKPGTGKSYVMKFMYGLHEAFSKTTQDLNLIVKKNKILKEGSDNLLLEAKEKGLHTEKFENLKEKKFDELKEFADIATKLSKLQAELKKIDTLNIPYKNINEENFANKAIENIIKAIFTDLSQISGNFFVEYLNQKIFNNNDDLKITSSNNTMIVTQNIFVETPLILELHKYMDRREAKTPYHIESLLNVLDKDYSFTDEEQDELIKSFTQKSNSIIGGNISNKDGSFVFSRNNDKDYNIFNASSGIKSIGLLQYLVTNKALKKGSVLFWEEPEVHLHPEWQLRMVELFVELMNAGVKIVFSTHSPYMADYLNAISKKRKISERVSFNLLQEKDGVVINYILDDKKDWKKIQTELLDPLEEIMWEYL